MDDWRPEGTLPEGCVPVAAVMVHLYLTPDGRQQFGVVARGDAPMTTYLGMLRVADHEVLQWQLEEDD